MYGNPEDDLLQQLLLKMRMGQMGQQPSGTPMSAGFPGATMPPGSAMSVMGSPGGGMFQPGRPMPPNMQAPPSFAEQQMMRQRLKRFAPRPRPNAGMAAPAWTPSLSRVSGPPGYQPPSRQL